MAEPSLRACERCLSGRLINGRLYCIDRIVCGPATAVPCDQARSKTGGCGWEAARLHWPDIGAGLPVGVVRRKAA